MRGMLLLNPLVGIIFVGISGVTSGVSLSDSLTTPMVRSVGEDALITCVVRDQSNFTLMWRRNSKGKLGTRILTANAERVTSDDRISVIHEEGGSVYVLFIQNITLKDDGMYTCEVNSDPPIRSFHKLSVVEEYMTLDTSLVAPPPPASGSQPEPDSLNVWGYSTARPITHDYTDCCVGRNVSTACQGFCNLKSILDGQAGSNPTDCEADFPSIASCMADGRDHMPCCTAAGIPPVCTDLCRGEYNVQTDLLKTHFSCAKHTPATLACIAAGIDLLPSAPQDLVVSALNDSALQISWSPPRTDLRLVKEYVVNVTYHQVLAPVYSATMDNSDALSIYPPFSTLHRVSKNKTSLVVADLEIFSLYEVSMWAQGVNAGKSQTTYKEMVVTHIKGDETEHRSTKAPNLPDIKSCCIARNVNHTQCVDKFCDPLRLDTLKLTDMMICAPWDTEVFSCLADGRDHTPCCAAKNLPPVCQELCSGNVTNINFNYFKCLSYMPEMSSCLLEGYGVLPSAPINFKFSNVHTTFGIFHWDKPDVLGDSVKDYTLVYKKYGSDRNERVFLHHAESPFVLENLESSSTYEVYVVAVNDHGSGEESVRIVFRTASNNIKDIKEKETPYNQTACCINSGIKPMCASLCSYNVKMSEVSRLGPDCAEEMSKVLRCAVGGRDHLPCCTQRGVPKSCQPLCQAVHQRSTGADFNSCLPVIGQVLTCLEEGPLQLPAPVKDLRAVEAEDGRVVVAWRSGSTNVSHWEVYYKKMEGTANDGTVFASDKQLNATTERAEVENLEVGAFYRFFVIARNDWGTSLPSALVIVNASRDAWEGKAVKGASSPPHLMEVKAHSATWLQFSWNPPAISHPEDVIKYRLYYRQVSDNTSEFTKLDTDLTSITLKNLNPNTQYIAYASSITSNSSASDYTLSSATVESEAGETLVAWTDPAFPAFVEAPTIHPINMVTEGSSMTILCIAMGTPLPTVTLYVDGNPIRSDVTRHMVTVVHNVTRDMGQVSCYADNGYGTPMQASRKITISRAPTLRAPVETHVLVGDELILKCKVDAFPAPTIAVFRDKDLQQSVRNDGRVTLTADASSEDPASFVLQMKIKPALESDGGKYFCHGNNSLGESIAFMGVNVTTLPVPEIDVRECCRRENVTSDCLDICSFSIDFDTMLSKPYCIPQFDKLMKCASDGSDHRHCCKNKGVPNNCINWCRGQPTDIEGACALTHSRDIIGCFHEGNQHLPGPPRNVVVRLVDKDSATVHWDVPEKNADAVELYRVYWRPQGAKDTVNNDTTDTKLELKNLVGGTTYELVVKAGNSKGTSHLTAPLRFITGDEVIIETSARTGNGASEVVGIILVVAVLLALFAFALYVMKKKNIIVLSAKKPNSPTVAFENPFYTSRDNQLNNQVITESSVEISSSGSWQGEMAERQGPGPAEEADQTTPSRFAPIKFGKAGQGFQRFK